MGLTIHYELTAKSRDSNWLRATLLKIRDLANEYAFQEVGHLRTLDDAAFLSLPHRQLRECPDYVEVIFHEVTVPVPWRCATYRKNDRSWRMAEHVYVRPSLLTAFSVDVAPGSEGLELGFCVYPRTVTATYRPIEDRKYMSRWHQRDRHGVLDRVGWLCDSEKLRRAFPGADSETWEAESLREVKTRKPYAIYGSFCKTCYAADEHNGGSVLNFLQAHISVISLLERIRELPGLVVSIHDEAGFANQDTAVGQRDVVELAAQVGCRKELFAVFGPQLRRLFGARPGDYELDRPGRPTTLEFLAALRPHVVPKQLVSA